MAQRDRLRNTIVFFLIFIHSGIFAQQNPPEDFPDSWSGVSSIGFTPRAMLTCAYVDGKIYAIGGYNASTYLNTVEVFDPAADTWSSPAITGTFAPRRGSSSAVINGKIYVIGGFDTKKYFDTLEVFDPSLNIWSVPSVSGTFTPREKLCAVVFNGKIYAMGGYNGITHLNTLEVFDPVANSWSTPVTTGTFTPRRGLAANVVNGKIYVLGGYNGSNYLNTLEVFDPATNSWSTPITTGKFTERGAFLSGVLDNKIYAIGGIHYTSTYIDVTPIEVFDPIANSWSTVMTTGTFTTRHELSGNMINNKIFAIGGMQGSNFLSTNEVFTSSNNKVETPTVPEIQLSPNPTNGILTIHNIPSNNLNISVLNILGETIIELRNVYSTDFILDLSRFIRGSYYIRIFSANLLITKVVIKE